MIMLTKLDGEQLVVNAELIESIHCGTDTLVALTNGRKLIVREAPAEVVRLALAYRVQVGAPPPPRLAAGEWQPGERATVEAGT